MGYRGCWCVGVAPGRCEGGVHCWLISLEFDPELMEWEGVRATAGCFSAGISEKSQSNYILYREKLISRHYVFQRKVGSANGGDIREFEWSWLACGGGGCFDASEAVVAGVGGAP